MVVNMIVVGADTATSNPVTPPAYENNNAILNLVSPDGVSSSVLNVKRCSGKRAIEFEDCKFVFNEMNNGVGEAYDTSNDFEKGQ